MAFACGSSQHGEDRCGADGDESALGSGSMIAPFAPHYGRHALPSFWPGTWAHVLCLQRRCEGIGDAEEALEHCVEAVRGIRVFECAAEDRPATTMRSVFAGYNRGWEAESKQRCSPLNDAQREEPKIIKVNPAKLREPSPDNSGRGSLLAPHWPYPCSGCPTPAVTPRVSPTCQRRTSNHHQARACYHES